MGLGLGVVFLLIDVCGLWGLFVAFRRRLLGGGHMRKPIRPQPAPASARLPGPVAVWVTARMLISARPMTRDDLSNI